MFSFVRHLRTSLAVACGAAALGACARSDVAPSGPVAPAPTVSAATQVAAATFTRVTAGLDNSCVLDASGQAFCMGYGGRGAVGYGGSATFIIDPYPVTGGLTFSSIAAGAMHVCALTTSNQGYCWGNNENGELGTATPTKCLLGTYPCSLVPVAVSGGLTMSAIDAGNQYSCALDAGGKAYCWGDNLFAQLGDGTTTPHTTPAPVAGGLTFVQIHTGGFHACGLTAAGELYCWGQNAYGQLGSPSTGTCTYFQPYPCSLTPIRVGGALRFKTFDAGTVHTCAITTAGAAYCWGNNSHGQLGTAAPGDKAVPTPVNTSQTFTQISTGSEQTCAINPSFVGYCWGKNSAVVTPVAGFTWTALAPNDDHRCGITTSGTAYCWGLEQYGELGDLGTHQDLRTAPTPIAPPHGVDQPPVARIIVTGCVNLACSFDATFSRDDFGIVSYAWDFGDGTTGTGAIANHTYPASGTYLVTLTVADSAGQTSTAVTNVTVFYQPPNQPPVARFVYSCNAATKTCTLDASRSSDDQGIASYAWNSNAAQHADKTGLTITRRYTASGQSWKETLTVTDAQGLTGKLTRTIVTP